MNNIQDELIDIPAALSSEELIDIPQPLSNNASSTNSLKPPGGCTCLGGGQQACGVCETHLEACPMGECGNLQCGNVQCASNESCNWQCEVECQSCEGATCQKFCQNCEGACEDTCQKSCLGCETGCQISNQHCTADCQDACQIACQNICEGCMTTCEVNASCQGNCQNCQGVACQTSCQNCEGVSCQICQTCQVGCQNCQGVACQTCQDTCEKSCQNCEGACETYCENYCQTACEYCQTYCQLYCQNCEGVSCQTCQDSCQLSCQNGQDPCLISCQALGKWEWSSHVEQGYQLQLTADEWNQFTTRINYTRVCHGLEIASFTAAVKGQQMMATQANEAVNAISAMNPSVATPSTVTSNSPITAQFINGLANSLNSL